ncbi:CRP-like cAMP-binding protein [Pseudonocardia kunmingensis]|uniref:CRP-like cAMP-binding protein n=1 Tax=Pseudonocardia kunmingensis TaxID=630975 RepID=A0A543DI21_9PSEU|nr:CRP-like cAMP-binding protein [Pseudonocardia kunmingensis]
MARLLPAPRDALLAQAHVRRFAPADALLRQGATDRHAYLILAGDVAVHVIDSSGIDAMLAVRRRGDIVGELAALTGEPRSATVVAMTRVTAGVITASALTNVLTTYPTAAWELVRTQAHRLDWANRRRVDFVSRRATARVARVLADLAHEIGSGNEQPIRVELSQRDIASIVGMALNTAENALRSLAHHGYIERRYRAVLIVDLAGLAEFADWDRDNP